MWTVMFVGIFPGNFPNIFQTDEPNNSRLITRSEKLQLTANLNKCDDIVSAYPDT